MIIVDTSVIIDHLRRVDKINSLLHQLALGQEDLAVSIITHTELYAGKSVWERKNARADLELIFSGLVIKPLTENISLAAGKIKAQSELDLIDSIIAATAIEEKARLVTLNHRHFSRIKELQILNR